MLRLGQNSLMVGTLLFGACVATPDEGETVSDVQVGDSVILQWNQIAISTIGAVVPAPAPFASTRFMAIVQLSVFEGVNAVTQEYTPYFGITAPRTASPEAAAIAAAHDTLAWLFPAQQATLDADEATSLAAIADGQSKTDGVTAGQAAAAAMIAARTGDGSAPPQFFVPPNSDPGMWQKTPSCPAGGGVFKQWPNVKPFGIESSSQFRSPPPPALPSLGYAIGYDEVQAVGDINSPNRPQDRSNVAKIYAAQPPHVGWNSMARQLAGVRHDNISRTARIFALMNMSLADAHISVFETKYFYNLWRPETAIPRGDEDNNPLTAPGPFTPFIVTPCFPAYPSAHGVGAGAGATVLALFYGDGGHNLTNSDPSVPGVVLTYNRLDQIVHDVSDARVFGGIHMRYDQTFGELMGGEIGLYNAVNYLR